MPHCLSSRSLLRTRTYSPIALQGSPQRRGRRQFPSPQVCLEYVENIEEKVGAKRVVYPCLIAVLTLKITSAVRTGIL
jgi:hypothetical protein